MKPKQIEISKKVQLKGIIYKILRKYGEKLLKMKKKQLKKLKKSKDKIFKLLLKNKLIKN